MKKTLRIFLSSLSLTALLAGPTIALAESVSCKYFGILELSLIHI